MPTYVFDNQEVKLTGRIAERKLKTAVAELVEITPVDPDLGSWKKWVDRKGLFEVKEPPNV